MRLVGAGPRSQGGYPRGWGPIAQQELDGGKGEKFFSEEYAIPEELTKGKSKVTVRFESSARTIVGGVFGVAVLDPKK